MLGAPRFTSIYRFLFLRVLLIFREKTSQSEYNLRRVREIPPSIIALLAKHEEMSTNFLRKSAILILSLSDCLGQVDPSFID